MSNTPPSNDQSTLFSSQLLPKRGSIDNLEIRNSQFEIGNSKLEIHNSEDDESDWETQAERFERRVSENLESLRIKGQEFMEDILRLVSNIDKLLLACDRLLYKSQPPSSGRIRVSWEHSENQRYNPVIVRWKRTRNNKWRYDRLSRPTSAVSSKGGFLTHRDEVLVTLKLIQQLIAHRNDVLGYLKNLGQGLTQKDKSVELCEDTVLLTLIDLVKSVNSKGVVKLELEELFKR